MAPPAAELRFFDPTAFLAVDLCRVSISPPFTEHCKCSGKSESLEKPVRSTGGASQADNLFGPELLLTQGDIAEGDVFNVTWTGSSILSRGCFTVSLPSLKGLYSIGGKPSSGLLTVTIETHCFQITPNLSPGSSRIGLQ